MMDLIKGVMSDNGERLIMLLGLHGVGKSSVARNALHYIHERRYMSGGIVWVQLKGVRDVYSVTKQIQSYIYRSINWTKEEIAELTRDTCTEEDLLVFIINFLNNPKSTVKDKFRRQSLQSKGSSYDFLICFDNAEELIIHLQNVFHDLLKKLTDDCPKLRIIVTSNKGLN